MPYSLANRRPFRTVLFLTTFAMALASCGSDNSPIEAGEDNQVEGQPPSFDAPPSSDQQDGDPQDGDMPDLSGGYESVAAMLDIVDPQVADIDDVIVDADDVTLVVRYSSAAEPCSGAIVEVVETETSVAVTLKTGLNPNAAAMTCVAGVFGYEQAAPLAAPLAGRDIVIVGSLAGGTAGGDQGGDTGGDAGGTLTNPDGFIGLPLEEAQLLAEQENRPWRIGRQDDESFALTEDYNEQRVTFDIDDGVVTGAVTG